jgi:hypothetical protein
MYGEHAKQSKNLGVKLPIGVVENLAIEEASPTTTTTHGILISHACSKLSRPPPNPCLFIPLFPHNTRVISKVTLSSPCLWACFHPLSPLSVVSAKLGNLSMKEGSLLCFIVMRSTELGCF